jgi:hypothetical protein
VPDRPFWSLFLVNPCRRCFWLALATACILTAGVLPGDEPPDEKPAAKRRLTDNELKQKLAARTDIDARKLPLEDAVKLLSLRHGIPIRLDKEGLKKAGVAADVPITASIRNFTLNAALAKILEDHKLHHILQDGAIVITDPATGVSAILAATDDAKPPPPPMALKIIEGGNRILVELPPQQEQFAQRFHILLLVELRFIRGVCRPTPEELRQLFREGERHVKEAAREFAKFQQRPRGGLLTATAGTAPDPRDLIRKAVAESVGQLLSAEQVARYREETDKRVANTRQAAIHAFVSHLDRTVTLSTGQRKKLCDSLAASWNDAWNVFQTAFVNGSVNLPAIPDELVNPVLDDSQRNIWHNAAKTRYEEFGAVPFVIDAFEANAAVFEFDVDGGPDTAPMQP